MKQTFDIYQVITDKITAMLEQGVIPWKRPWTGVLDGATSYSTGKPYSYLNQLMLEDPGEYITFSECERLGGHIKKGAKSKMVVFWKWLTVAKKGEDGQPVIKDGEPQYKEIPMLRYFNVFNIQDCEGIEPHAKEEYKPVDPIEEGEEVIAGYLGRETELRFQNDRPSNRAYYSPGADKVVVPMREQYNHLNEYYSTTFHELTHSTLKASRCNREEDNKLAAFGSADYSREELVAELGSAYLMGRCGIDTDKTTRNSAGYIQGWLRALKNDKNMIVWAAGRAEYAAKYILTGEKRKEE